MEVQKLIDRLRDFAAERAWEQFHSPKNLSMALAAEAGELLEIFQWLTEEESRNLATQADELRRVREEVGDVAIYLIRLCDQLGIDLEQAALEKIEQNEAKYPVKLSRGNATKYNRRGE